jgi:hypothetical protein
MRAPRGGQRAGTIVAGSAEASDVGPPAAIAEAPFVHVCGSTLSTPCNQEIIK